MAIEPMCTAGNCLWNRRGSCGSGPGCSVTPRSRCKCGSMLTTGSGSGWPGNASASLEVFRAQCLHCARKTSSEALALPGHPEPDPVVSILPHLHLERGVTEHPGPLPQDPRRFQRQFPAVHIGSIAIRVLLIL